MAETQAAPQFEGGDVAHKYQRRFMQLENFRYEFEQDWLDIQKYILPRKGLFYRKGQRVRDKRKHAAIIDPEATLNLKDLAAGLLTGMTPKTRPWLRLTLQNTDLMEFPPVKEWFHAVTQRMLDVFAWSNLYTSLHTVYRETAAFGTGPLLEEFDLADLIRFTTFTTGEFYIAVNERGDVDTFYRQYEMTARNIVDQFGEENVSQTVKTNAVSTNTEDKYHQICHAIQPNKTRDSDKIDIFNMPFESVHWEKGKEKRLLKVSGFEEFPVFVPRWDVTSTQSPYGEGPARDMLGHVKMLQEMGIGQIKGMHKELNPPMRVPSSFKGRLSLVPGAQNVDPDPGGRGISSIYDIKFNYRGISEKIADIREQIRRGFFNDLFRMLSLRRGIQPLSVEEVIKQSEEQLVLISPILERFHSDLLNPTIKRTFNIMLRNSVLLPPPEEIEGQRIRVEYTSMLAQTQKLMGLQPIQTFLGFIGGAAGLQPEVLDKVDFDEMADEYGDAAGVPPKVIMSDDRVAEIRQARAEEVQAQRDAEMATAMVQGAKSLSETSTEEGNVVGDLVEGISGE